MDGSRVPHVAWGARDPRRPSPLLVAVKPPKDGGKVTVVYPVELAPDGTTDEKK